MKKVSLIALLSILLLVGNFGLVATRLSSISQIALGASSIDVENIYIGTGTECFRFAIFADPQVGTGGGSINELIGAVNSVIDINNDGNPNNDISFVVVLGDLIQGERNGGAWKDEADYRDEYNQVKTELDRLGIHYIPVIGNHDVWFKFNDYSTVGGPPDYPEELFADYFGPKYEELSTDLIGWRKQETMPSTNPYYSSFPAPLFQNFAFDFGPYHFIFLDFSARDDFDPITGFSVKKFFGYADLHDFTNGTWQWLESHLQWCQQAGIEDVIIFTHHPPIYELDTTGGNVATLITPGGFPIPFSSYTEIKGEIHIVNDTCSGGPLTGKTLSNYRTGSGFQSWDSKRICYETTLNRAEGDAIFAFNKQIYDGQDEYDRFATLSSTYGINVIHWFSGHYHLKGFNWHDNGINTDVSAIPSVMTADNIYGFQLPQVKLNEQSSAVVTPGGNPNGSLTIVHVSSNVGVDVMIRDCPWDVGTVPSYNACENGWIHLSPDIWVTSDSAGTNVISNPAANQANYLWARVWNIGGSTAYNTTVSFYWADYGVGWPPSTWYHLGDRTISNLAPGTSTIVVPIEWEPLSEEGTEHRCIFVKLINSGDLNGSGWDSNLDNNIGWKNFTVEGLERKIIDGKVSYTAKVHFKLWNPSDSVEDVSLQMYSPDLTPAATAKLIPPEENPFTTAKCLVFTPGPGLTCEYTWASMSAGEKRDVTLSVHIPSGAESYTATFHITGTIDNKPIGGISVKFVRQWFVPKDYPTIQQAIDAASDGDTVLVAPGTYKENINFKGKSITVKSQKGPNGTFIDGKLIGSVVTFNSGEGRGSVLEGFTVMNGMAPSGGGIFIENSSPTIRDCYIRGNLASGSGHGGGIYISGSSASPLIFNNLIYNNTASGPPGGGGIHIHNGASPVIKNCTISKNLSNTGGGISVSGDSSVQVKDSIIWANMPRDLYYEGGASLDITFTDIGETVPGEGNISKNPLFVRGILGDFYLSQKAAGQANDSPV